MFRLTIRELLLSTVCAALGVSLWQASHVSRVAASDSLELADYAANARFGRCSDPERLGALLKKVRRYRIALQHTRNAADPHR